MQEKEHYATHHPNRTAKAIGRLLGEARKTGTEADDNKNRTTVATERNENKNCEADQE